MAIDFKKLLAESKSTAPQVASQTSVITPEVTVPPVAVGQPVITGVESTVNNLGMLNESAPAGAVVEYPGLHDLRDRIYALDKALLAKHPVMDSLLQTIHRNLQKDPELIHLLTSEQRAMIFAGLKNKTQTVIVTETVKSAGSGKNKGLKSIGLEDM